MNFPASNNITQGAGKKGLRGAGDGGRATCCRTCSTRRMLNLFGLHLRTAGASIHLAPLGPQLFLSVAFVIGYLGAIYRVEAPDERLPMGH